MTTVYFLTILETGHLRPRYQQIQFLVGLSSSFEDTYLLAVPSMAERERALVCFLLLNKDTNPTVRSLPSWPPKGSTSLYHYLRGWGFNIWIWGKQHILSIYKSLSMKWQIRSLGSVLGSSLFCTVLCLDHGCLWGGMQSGLCYFGFIVLIFWHQDTVCD